MLFRQLRSDAYLRWNGSRQPRTQVHTMHRNQQQKQVIGVMRCRSSLPCCSGMTKQMTRQDPPVPDTGFKEICTWLGSQACMDSRQARTYLDSDSGAGLNEVRW